jgi:hypothetical protein
LALKQGAVFRVQLDGFAVLGQSFAQALVEVLRFAAELVILAGLMEQLIRQEYSVARCRVNACNPSSYACANTCPTQQPRLF